ncbi:phorbol-12-myristate-13-acetate-induced protein 1 [Fukomys damarensis]|uniref:phorbol-12-myristate-13-acetate-induced protein 1 n=1 Tax=Fukomys damarensis TaxID=885580 RepID=UPI00053F61B4|nr:phorbol-12-myristate-13-acetate-induced protein 1 [Fukomys damarensis]
MAGKVCKSVQPNSTRAPAELEVKCAAQLRRIGDKLNPLGCATEIWAVLAEMPGKKARKNSQQGPPRAQAELEVECAAQFRRIGDKLNFRQKLMNLISKLFSLIT